MNIYYRDVAKELYENNATLNDFDWIKNIRMYLNSEHLIIVKCGNS